MTTKSLNDGAGFSPAAALSCLRNATASSMSTSHGEDELRRGGLGLRHPARDRLLQPREVLDRRLAAARAGVARHAGLGASRFGASSSAPPRPRPRRPRLPSCPAAASTSALTIRPPGPAARQRRTARRRAPAPCAARSATPSRGRCRPRRLASRLRLVAPRSRLGLVALRFDALGLRPRPRVDAILLGARRSASGLVLRPRLAPSASALVLRPRPRRRLVLVRRRPRRSCAIVSPTGERVALLGDDLERPRPGRPRRSCWPCPSRSRRAPRPLDLVPVGLQPLEDRALLHRVGQAGHRDVGHAAAAYLARAGARQRGGRRATSNQKRR